MARARGSLAPRRASERGPRAEHVVPSRTLVDLSRISREDNEKKSFYPWRAVGQPRSQLFFIASLCWIPFLFLVVTLSVPGNVKLIPDAEDAGAFIRYREYFNI